MTNNDRAENQRQYLDDIDQAIKRAYVRCGDTMDNLNEPFPTELTMKQRAVFVHSGISALLSSSIKTNDQITLELFDWLLGYFAHRGGSHDDTLVQYLESLLVSLQNLIIQDFKHERRPNFLCFMVLFKLSIMALGGTMTETEMKTIGPEIVPLLVRCVTRRLEKLRADVEKN